jgi:hypothetical protein
MQMAKTATLSSGLVARKGAAVPTVTETDTEHLSPVSPIKKTEAVYYKALTVKLDKERFHKLKQAGLIADKSSQEIFVEALDAYLSKDV